MLQASAGLMFNPTSILRITDILAGSASIAAGKLIAAVKESRACVDYEIIEN